MSSRRSIKAFAIFVACWLLGVSSVSDSEYDEMVEELAKLTGGYDPVVGPVVASSGKVRHPVTAPMLSMQKVYSVEEIEKWMEKMKGAFYVMPKYDGIALRRYGNGVIATRGSGSLGENVTETARVFVERAHAPLTAFVDGEAVCTLSAFGQLARLGYKNPRNAVSGILSSKDPAIRARADVLTFKPYMSSVWKYAPCVVSTPPLVEVIENVKRVMSDYPTDGIVFRVSDESYFKALGHTDHHWRGQIALKFKGDVKETAIRRIEWQVRNGTVTPVAILLPVELDGAEISRVTLHNADYVATNSICAGDSVVIERAGGVIPSIVRVVHGRDIGRPSIPAECPVCHSQLLRNGARLYCAVCEAKGEKQ